jgi:VanZ family protein
MNLDEQPQVARMLDLRGLFFKLVFLGSLTLLMVGSLLPANQVPAGSIDDKLLHFAAYTFVGVLAALAFRRRSARFASLALLVLLGVGLEFGQTYVPGRSFELWDMAANSCGAFTALTTARILPTW